MDHPTPTHHETEHGRHSWVKYRTLALTGLALASVLTAAFFAGQARALRETLDSADSSPVVGQTPNLSAQQLAKLASQLPTASATAAVTSEKFSMATGLISQQAEGLFVLDHNSGLLQCSVMYPRVGQFLGLFTVNVHDALGTGKGAQYMMTTGLVDMPQSNNNPLASSVVYVLNTTTGAYACYYIPFNRTLLNSNRAQQGSMVLLATGSADPVIDRDAVR